jgi:hypothetical protein
MNSVKRYNLERNRAFNEQRTADDRRAYRAIMKAFQRENAEKLDPARLRRQSEYLDALLRHGNKAASFPSFDEWGSGR